MAHKILIIAPVENGTVESAVLELILLGRQLGGGDRSSVQTALLGDDFGDGVLQVINASDVTHQLQSPLLSRYQCGYYLQATLQLCKHIDPDVVLLAHNLDNAELAPCLAYWLAADLTTDCIGIEPASGSNAVLCTKEVYGGNANAVFEATTKPAVVTVRAKGLKTIELPAGKGERVVFDLSLNEQMMTTETVERVSQEAEDFAKAEVVVSGGRGLGGAEGVEPLEALLAAFKKGFEHVVLGGSRPVIDEKWMPGFRQIGLTGQKVNPRLYIAVGISGALQHMTGIFGSQKIVAINNNADAAIFKYADYGIVGDYKEVISGLTQKMKEIL